MQILSARISMHQSAVKRTWTPVPKSKRREEAAPSQKPTTNKPISALAFGSDDFIHRAPTDRKSGAVQSGEKTPFQGMSSPRFSVFCQDRNPQNTIPSPVLQHVLNCCDFYEGGWNGVIPGDKYCRSGKALRAAARLVMGEDYWVDAGWQWIGRGQGTERRVTYRRRITVSRKIYFSAAKKSAFFFLKKI